MEDGDSGKVFVKVLRHPVSKNENKYSYAVLLNVFGSLGISDYSGWLIFYNCTTDYSGVGGTRYEKARMILEARKKGYIRNRRD